MKTCILTLLLCISLFFPNFSSPPGGYDLWLKYEPLNDKALTENYRSLCSTIYIATDNETLDVAKKELNMGLGGLLSLEPQYVAQAQASLIIAKYNDLDKSLQKQFSDELPGETNGFFIKSVKTKKQTTLFIVSNDDLGLLYGVFRFLQLIQTQQDLSDISLSDGPKLDLRLLNHWDNLDRTVERGYAGASLWNWQKLPEYIDQRYIDYARANASIGINGTSLTNVNANADILTPEYLEKVAALANTFRPYGIRVYLTARFSAPMELDGLSTADPLDPAVQDWWMNKVKEIYKHIPDFGGFLVKANSEGQPGPQDYNRTHMDGANMLARALQPYNSVVMWRAFVYSEHDNDDRTKQAFNEFVPFDGQFEDNVLLQTKNGPLDFQPREPFHPVFGAMPKTNLMMEFQVAQEYTGFSSHLVFLPKLYQEVLSTDTYMKGKGSQVSKVIDGSLHGNKRTGMAGVSNIGNDLNWTGHPFGQANWYGYGRLAWDPNLDPESIAKEWLSLTYSNDADFINAVSDMMILSREAVVNYMNPYGLHHIFATHHHHGPGPWVDDQGRPEWNPVYYHKADEQGIGFDRTKKGSNAVGQYADQVAQQYGSLENCPEEYLLWFHRVSWDHQLKNGETLWDGMALKYQEGVDQVRGMISTWEAQKQHLSALEYSAVRMHLDLQLKEAIWWKDACLSYFQTFSKRPLPDGVEKPLHDLEYYKRIKFPYAPGIRPSW